MRIGRDWRTIGIVAGIVAGVLLLAAAGLGGYFYWKSQQAVEEIASKSSGSSVIPLSVADTPNEKNSEEYVETPSKVLAAKLNKQFVGNTLEPSISGPFGRVGDHKFFVRVDEYHGVAATGTKAQAEANLVMMKRELAQQKYTETVRQKGSATQSFDALYTGNGVLCEMYDRKPAAGDKKKLYEAGILCADATQFEETSGILEPYVKSYQTATKADVANKGFYGLRVSSSPVDGYRRAGLNITGENQDINTGFLVVFYQTPDGVWRYFTSTQGLVACSKYQVSTELLNAFKGEPCTVNGKASAVGASNN